MSRKIRFISLLTLLICFLMGCSLFQKNGGGPGEQGGKFSESVRKLREKYSKILLMMSKKRSFRSRKMSLLHFRQRYKSLTILRHCPMQDRLS